MKLKEIYFLIIGQLVHQTNYTNASVVERFFVPYLLVSHDAETYRDLAVIAQLNARNL